MRTVADYRTKKNLSEWTPIVEDWLLVMQRMLRLSDKNPCFMLDSEKGLASLFSSAAWRSGWGAFVEMKRKKKDGSPGQLDLWLSSGSKEFMCEFKFNWIGSHVHDDDLQLACNQISQYASCGETPVGLAVLYLSVNIPTWRREMFLAIRSLFYLYNRNAADIIAWCFPASQRFAAGRSTDYCPGLILLAKES